MVIVFDSLIRVKPHQQKKMDVEIVFLENGYAILKPRRFYSRSFEQICDTVRACLID